MLKRRAWVETSHGMNYHNILCNVYKSQVARVNKLTVLVHSQMNRSFKMQTWFCVMHNHHTLKTTVYTRYFHIHTFLYRSWFDFLLDDFSLYNNNNIANMIRERITF